MFFSSQSVLRLLFPKINRTFQGKRWVKISLRMLHLLGIVGFCAGVFFDVPQSAWNGYLILSLFSGYAMVALELWTNGLWLIQVRGVSMVLKLCLLWGLEWHMWNAPIFLWIVILLSGFVAHAPGDIRYFSLVHRRRIDNL